MGIKTEIYNEITREYDRERSNNQHKHDVLMAEIHEKIPEYGELERLMPQIASDAMKLIIAGNKNAVNESKAKLDEVGKKMKALLVKNGYPEDAAEPIFTCRECKDTGYVDGQRCRCFTQKLLLRLYSQSNIGDVLERENFDTFSYDYYTDSELETMNKIVKRCKKYADNFGSEYRNILFRGSPGVGKTFLTNCIAKAVLDKGYSVIYFTANNLFEQFSNVIFGGYTAQSKDELKDDLFSCDLLIIDDLGTELINKMVVSQFFSIVNERHLLQKPTIISTNLSFEEISDRYTDRIISRIIGNYDVMIPNISDIRLKKRNIV